MSLEIVQKELALPRLPRGFHLITEEVATSFGQLQEFEIGRLHLHLLHTSAALTINENASHDVPGDLAHFFDGLVPDDYDGFEHTIEGPDDMPAHVKASIIGCDVTVPIRSGRMLLGTWQGIFLCEFRDRPSRRSIVATATGRLR